MAEVVFPHYNLANPRIFTTPTTTHAARATRRRQQLAMDDLHLAEDDQNAQSHNGPEGYHDQLHTSLNGNSNMVGTTASSEGLHTVGTTAYEQYHQSQGESSLQVGLLEMESDQRGARSAHLPQVPRSPVATAPDPFAQPFKLPEPASANLNVPSGGRRHGHRRSRAISQQSVSLTNSTAALPSGTDLSIESAPVTPSDERSHFPSPAKESRRAMSHSALRAKSMGNADILKGSPEPSPRRASRVTFNEQVEVHENKRFSTISSETSSSMSTIKGHATTGSTSSFTSPDASGAVGTRDAHPLPIGSQPVAEKPRPSTAGSILDAKSPIESVSEGAVIPERPRSVGNDSVSPSAFSAGSPLKNRGPQRRVSWLQLGSSRIGSSAKKISGDDRSPPESPRSAISDTEGSNLSAIAMGNLAYSRYEGTSRKCNLQDSLTALLSGQEALLSSAPRGSLPEAKLTPALDDPFTFDDAKILESLDQGEEGEIITSDQPPARSYRCAGPRPVSQPAMHRRRYDNDEEDEPEIDLDSAYVLANDDKTKANARRVMASGTLFSSSSQRPHGRSVSAPNLPHFHRAPGMVEHMEVFEEEAEEEDAPVRVKEMVKSRSQETVSTTSGKQAANASLPVRSANHTSALAEGADATKDTPEKKARPLSQISYGSSEATPRAERSLSPANGKSSPVEIVEHHEEPRVQSSLGQHSDSIVTVPLICHTGKGPAHIVTAVPSLAVVEPPMTPDTLASEHSSLYNHNDNSFSTPPSLKDTPSLADTPRHSTGTFSDSITTPPREASAIPIARPPIASHRSTTNGLGRLSMSLNKSKLSFVEPQSSAIATQEREKKGGWARKLKFWKK